MTLDELKKLCAEYDDEYGDYPEHRFEGASVFSFIEKKFTGAQQPHGASPTENAANVNFESW